jgi:hypothetical protein
MQPMNAQGIARLHVESEPRRMALPWFPLWLAAAALFPWTAYAQPRAPITLNVKDDGYRGMWHQTGGTMAGEWVYKYYSGGLSTYPSQLQPLAVHCAAVKKTFFCYGGTTKTSYTRLLHVVSYYDHKTGTVPRPTIVLDKQTSDAHDNPVMSVDDEGYIWIFSNSHGTSRPAYIHRSKRPYDIDEFQLVEPTRIDDAGQTVAMDNYSYMEAWHLPGVGFRCFFHHYGDPVTRTPMFMASSDGVAWSKWTRLGVIERGHYQVSAAKAGKYASALNFHPKEVGSDGRTNLYYVETTDDGKTWHTAGGVDVTLPLSQINNPALVHDYHGVDHLRVFLIDMLFDGSGHPVIFYTTSKQCGGAVSCCNGPSDVPRTWTIARWTGTAWVITPFRNVDNNYDFGSLYFEADGTWRIIGNADPKPQPWNTGGEIAIWVSTDSGATWTKVKQLTHGSKWNHGYVRRPINAHPEFYGFWADGDARAPSDSRLYFTDKDGTHIWRLPSVMTESTATPQIAW